MGAIDVCWCQRLNIPNLRQDYTLTNVRGIFGPLIAEYVLGYSIAHYRHFNRYHQQQQTNDGSLISIHHYKVKPW